jgi:hypothetical protein
MHRTRACASAQRGTDRSVQLEMCGSMDGERIEVDQATM